MEFDGNTFLLTNKEYPYANLAMWASNGMGTYEQKVYPDQFWQLEKAPNHSGYYTIKNIIWEGYRIAQWGDGDKDVGPYNGQYYEDQFWKFVQVEGDYYRIFNFRYPDRKLTKFGKGDGEWGTYKGADYNDQLWKLTPRFEAKIQKRTLWSCDNRQGSNDFSEEITITTGLKLTSSSSFSSKLGLEMSLTASVSRVDVSVEMQTTITSEITRSMSQGEEKTWSRQTKVTFTAPKGKNYRVKQIGCEFTSSLADDDCELGCNYVVEESDGPFTD